ncbi:ribosomal RNA-processing protein 14 [Euphorbia lathyris]|uniref:ribosomal RNA-processing protein 14 n=1 Tax=Euphorbia lathyris TaxID=212925 RepID=UPI003313E374
MKKKLQNPVNNVDLKAIIHENSLFFDKLIELIPPRFYLPVDDKDKKWFQGLSKDEKALAKKESRENIKKARRDRLDPEKSSASTLDMLMRNLEKEKTTDETSEEEVEINPMKSGLDGNDHSATYEELRQRLHRKIEELRGGRNSSSLDKQRKRNEKWEIHQKKRKRETVSEEKKPTSNSSEEKLLNDVADATKELKFSHVKLGSEEDHAKKKMKKHSKVKEFEKAKELEEAKKNPEKGDIISKKHSWKAAEDRAKGVKVHDDPKLLKLSLKKEKKMRQKNAEKWKERIESQQKMKSEKQQTRSQNIADRIHQKKARRIAKREKKLMRPGFEGRKKDFINQPSTAGPSS